MMRRVANAEMIFASLLLFKSIFSINFVKKRIPSLSFSSPTMGELTNWCFQINKFSPQNVVHTTVRFPQNKRQEKRLNTIMCRPPKNPNRTRQKESIKTVRHSIPRQHNPIKPGFKKKSQLVITHFFPFHIAHYFTVKKKTSHWQQKERMKTHGTSGTTPSLDPRRNYPSMRNTRIAFTTFKKRNKSPKEEKEFQSQEKNLFLL